MWQWKNHLPGLSAKNSILTVCPVCADTYHMADFSGNLGSSANVKPPFQPTLSPSDPVSGSFVYDDQLIFLSSPFPGVNVKFADFPDIGLIPPATAFTINLGAPELTFTLADAIQNSGAIQYLNGQFNGFFFAADFTFSVDSNPYRLNVQGLTFTIKLLNQLGGSPVALNSTKVSGRLYSTLENEQPYVPGAPLPSNPPAWLQPGRPGWIQKGFQKQLSGTCLSENQEAESGMALPFL